ncbi:MAG TPA: FkbM family methyltransferase [Chryseosolibacter sp.]
MSHDYPGEITLTREGARFDLLKTSLQLDSCAFILEGYGILRELSSLKAAKFSVSEKLFLIDMGGIVLNPTTAEELFIIHEIFVRGAYNFDLPDRCVAIDIGMNVGIASLFFASRSTVDKVFAFEPLRPTFQQAKVNFGLNKSLSDKIQAVNYGLGDQSGELTVDYDYSNKGQIGVRGTTFVRSTLQQVEKQLIVIREASLEVKRILSQHAGQVFILKVDCEGSEYPILQDLFRHGLLSRFRMVFIEWHEQGPEPLITLLRESGFVTFYQWSSSRAGMIYAAR